MRPINPKKIVASAIIYLFTSLSTPVLASEPPQQVAPVQQESVYVTQAPTVHISIPRVVNVVEIGFTPITLKRDSCTCIRGIDISYFLIHDLHPLLFEGCGTVSTIDEAYTNLEGGYLCLAPTNLETGCVQITHPTNKLEKNVQSLLSSPEKYQVRRDVLNAQLKPYLISDAMTRSILLVADPWDFRLAKQPQYSILSLNQMLANLYGSFKAYAQICVQKDPKMSVMVHSGFWGELYKNNARVTTTLQLLAARLANVAIIFHIQENTFSQQVISDAKDFLAKMQGNSVEKVLTSLMQQINQNRWMVGV